jgi:hypothetical protein
VINWRNLRLAGAVAVIKEMRNTHLFECLKEKRPVRYSGWEDNIKMQITEVGCDEVNWILYTQDRNMRRTFVCTVINLRVPWMVGNFFIAGTWGSCLFLRKSDYVKFVNSEPQATDGCNKQSTRLYVARCNELSHSDERVPKRLHMSIDFFSFLGWGETESTRYVGQ